MQGENLVGAAKTLGDSLSRGNRTASGYGETTLKKHLTDSTDQARGTAAGYSEPAKPPADLPVHRAMDELKKEVAMLRESAGMLISRLAPVSYPIDIKGRDDGPKEGCFVEIELRNMSASLSDVTQAMNIARESLCI